MFSVFQAHGRALSINCGGFTHFFLNRSKKKKSVGSEAVSIACLRYWTNEAKFGNDNQIEQLRTNHGDVARQLHGVGGYPDAQRSGSMSIGWPPTWHRCAHIAVPPRPLAPRGLLCRDLSYEIPYTTNESPITSSYMLIVEKLRRWESHQISPIIALCITFPSSPVWITRKPQVLPIQISWSSGREVQPYQPYHALHLFRSERIIFNQRSRCFRLEICIVCQQHPFLLSSAMMRSDLIPTKQKGKVLFALKGGCS